MNAASWAMLTSHQDGPRCHLSRTPIPPSAWREATRNGAGMRHPRVACVSQAPSLTTSACRMRVMLVSHARHPRVLRACHTPPHPLTRGTRPLTLMCLTEGHTGVTRALMRVAPQTCHPLDTHVTHHTHHQDTNMLNSQCPSTCPYIFSHYVEDICECVPCGGCAVS